MITVPVDLSGGIGAPVAETDPAQAVGSQSVRAQLQNTSAFNVLVNAGGDQLNIAPSVAQTFSVAGGQGIELVPQSIPSNNLVGTQATLIWLLAGEAPPIQDGPLPSQTVGINATVDIQAAPKLIKSQTFLGAPPWVVAIPPPLGVFQALAIKMSINVGTFAAVLYNSNTGAWEDTCILVPTGGAVEGGGTHSAGYLAITPNPATTYWIVVEGPTTVYPTATIDVYGIPSPVAPIMVPKIGTTWQTSRASGALQLSTPVTGTIAPAFTFAATNNPIAPGYCGIAMHRWAVIGAPGPVLLTDLISGVVVGYIPTGSGTENLEGQMLGSTANPTDTIGVTATCPTAAPTDTWTAHLTADLAYGLQPAYNAI